MGDIPRGMSLDHDIYNNNNNNKSMPIAVHLRKTQKHEHCPAIYDQSKEGVRRELNPDRHTPTAVSQRNYEPTHDYPPKVLAHFKELIVEPTPSRNNVFFPVFDNQQRKICALPPNVDDKKNSEQS